MIDRVVFDTSTLIGAALRVGSKPSQALMLTLEHCVLCGCEELIAELAEVLNRSSFDRYLTRQDRNKFIEMIRQCSEFHRIEMTAAIPLDPPCRDANDNFILALALVSQADVIVSSDQDLLALDPWNGIPILTSSQFVSQLSTRGSVS